MKEDLNYGQRVVDDPSCTCHFKEESETHFLLDCFLYTAECQTLFSLVEYYIPKFIKMNKKSKYELLISGLKNTDPDFFDVNRKITFAVQSFITNTKRFMHQQ